LKRARDLPGVKAASLAASTPNGSMAISMSVDVPGYTPKPVRGDDVVNFNFISPTISRHWGNRSSAAEISMNTTTRIVRWSPL
jgi:hypothetical protein